MTGPPSRAIKANQGQSRPIKANQAYGISFSCESESHCSIAFCICLWFRSLVGKPRLRRSVRSSVSLRPPIPVGKRSGRRGEHLHA